MNGCFNCTLCYIEDARGRYLLLHRVKKKNDENEGKWIGVGGKFESGESPEDCLLREVREETGLTLTDYRLRAVITFVLDGAKTEYMFLYTAAGWTGELASDCREGDLRWVDKRALYSLPIWEGDRLFLRRIEDPASPFFSMKLCYEGDELVFAALDGRPIALREADPPAP